MAVDSFIPTIWSARILQSLHKALVFGNVVNRDYEGEISAMGDTVRIGGIGAVTVGDYTKNSTTISWQTLADASQTLVIDQSKYFAFKVDDIDSIQTKPDLMDEAMREASYAIADTIDQFIAGKYADAAAANKVGSDGASAKVIGYGSGEIDAYKQLVDLGVLLTDANVPQEGRWGIVPPWFIGMLRKGATFTANAASPSGQQVIANGFVGRVAGFDLYESNNVTNDAQATPTYRAMFGVKSAVSLAMQRELSIVGRHCTSDVRPMCTSVAVQLAAIR
jgi:hypothetical protein